MQFSIDICQSKIDNAKQIQKITNRLPDDVLKKIYTDYFEGKNVYEEFLICLESENSVRLEYEHLLSLWMKVKAHPCLLEYLLKKCDTVEILKNSNFREQYDKHYVLKEKSFVRMTLDNSFVLCLLMSLYH